MGTIYNILVNYRNFKLFVYLFLVANFSQRLYNAMSFNFLHVQILAVTA